MQQLRSTSRLPPAPPAHRFSPGWGRFRAASPMWLLATGLAGLVSALVAWNGVVAAAVVLVGLVLSTAVALKGQLPRLALSFLGICLVGYALLGKAFAYVGVPPLFVGEMALSLCLLAVVLRGRVSLLAQSPVFYLLLLYMGIGMATTLPYLGQYGIDAIRDAVLWGYALFALCVAVLLVQFNWVVETIRQYARFIPVFLCASPVLLLVGKLLGISSLLVPGSGVTLLEVKGGDVAVMLAMVASLLLLGLHRLPELGAAGRALGEKREWLWWMLWIVVAALSIFRVRAGIIAIGVALLILLIGRAASRWQKPLLALVASLTLLSVFNVQIKVSEQRDTISVQSLLVNLQSIVSDSGDADRDGSKGWRLRWWNDIAQYTVNGPYFWTGKGYGINLADADGYQLGYYNGEATLRSPHNAHLNILARSGVPGVLAWAALQLTFAAMLILAYRRARSRGQDLWARLNLWTLASWAAFMVNASFDVYLEGPQGGIWFWSFFGFGIALLEVQRRGVAGMLPDWLQPTPQSAEVSPQGRPWSVR